MTFFEATVPRQPHILIVDDDEGDRKEVRRVLLRSGLDATFVERANVEDALAVLDSEEEPSVDCCIIDYRLPSGDGLSGIPALRARSPFMAIVMLTGQGDEQVAVRALKLGASDYLPKTNTMQLRQIVESALVKAVLERKIAYQREELELFSHVLAHDLMAPTRSLQGFAAFIQQALRNGDLEGAQESSEHVVGAARRMNLLVRTLHAYVAASVEPVRTTVSMPTVLTEVLRNLQDEISEARATITADPLPDVFANETQMVQLLQNLIGNSIKFRGSSDPVIHIASNAVEATWHIDVLDNSIGISSADVERIFQPFVRLGNKRSTDGSGLGLATCRRIIEMHGGHISASPRTEGGTSITFILPASGPAG